MKSSESARSPSAKGAIRSQWVELGGFRWAIVGMFVLTAGTAALLGLLIPMAVERHLIRERIENLTRITDELTEQGFLPGSFSSGTDLEAFDEMVRLHLLGGDIVRVKVWGPGGELLYSDIPALQDIALSPSVDATRVVGDAIAVGNPDLSRPEHEFERDLGDLVEFYVPILGKDGHGVSTVFEVYQDAAPIANTVASIRRLASLGAGLVIATLGLSLLTMTIDHARALNRRTRSAEDRADDLARAQDEERRRIVGALHDDIGQPLYRVLYGVQGARSQMTDGHIADELLALEGLIRSIDITLKTELRLLHADSMTSVAGNELNTLLGELVGQVERETALEVHLDTSQHQALAPAVSMTLFRAVREALTNAQKHSGARRVWVRLFEGNGRVILDVEDDGQGPPVEPGLGLITTRERLEAIGGGITVSARAGHGTLFRAWAPTEETSS